MTIVDYEQIDLENFHKSKFLSRECLHSKIHKKLQANTDALHTILVPSGLHISNTFYVKKPLKCSLHTSSATQENYLAHYGAGKDNWVNIWSKDRDVGKVTRQQIKIDCRIEQIVFIATGCIYLASCSDLTLRVFNNQFFEQSRVQLDYSIMTMMCDENKTKVITSRVGFIQQWEMGSGLYNSLEFISETRLHDHTSKVTPWISFIHHDKENDTYLAITRTGIFIVDAEKLEQLSFIENRHDFPISTCYTYAPRNYLFTGTKNGDIKAWNMSMYSFPYVGSFNGHLKRIVNILIHPAEELLITSSEDSTIRFWQIETFQETYRFNVLDTILNVFIINSHKLYYASPKGLYLLDFNYFHHIFALLGTKITTMERISSKVKPARMLVVGDDDSVKIVSPTHGNILTMEFPNITHQPVTYTHDPIEERIYTLLRDGGVLVMSTKTNPCSAVQMWKAPRLDDKVLCLGLIFLKVNGTIRSLLFGAHYGGQISLLKGTGLKMKPTSRSVGVIIKFQENIVDNPPSHFLTYNTEKAITLWKIKMVSDNVIALVAMDDIQLEAKPSHIILQGYHIGVASENIFMTINYTPRKQGHCLLKIYNHTKDEKHKEMISEVKGCSHLPIIATASVDGKVKIWSMKCGLLRELAFDRTLSGMSFANDRGDLLVGFQSNLHSVAVTEFLPDSYLKILLDDKYEDDATEYCIPFDPLLRFWYDKRWVPRIHVLNANKDVLEEIQLPLEKEDSEVIEIVEEKEQIFEGKKHSLVSEEDMIDFYTAALMLTRTRNQENNNNKNQWERLKSVSIKFRENSASKSSVKQENKSNISPNHMNVLNVSQVSLSEAIANEIMEMVQESPSVESLLELPNGNDYTRSSPHKEGSRAEIISNRKYWPCAPDGFIPNSVIRYLLAPPPPKTPPSNVPFKPRSFSQIIKGIPLFQNLDEDKDEVRQWYSDNDDTASEEDVTDCWDDFFMKSSQSMNQIEEPKEVKIKIEHIKRWKSGKSTSGKKPSSETKKKEAILEPVKAILEVEEVVSSPFDKYRDKPWFPKDAGLDIYQIVAAVIPLIDPSKPFVMKEILDFLVDVHQTCKIPSELYDKLLQRLIELLDNPSGQVRNYAVKTLLALGENRKDVLLRLVPKLGDADMTVRQVVKKALKDMAGIDSADALLKTLLNIKELKVSHVANDVEVIESFREVLESRRDSFFKRLIRYQQRHKGQNPFSNLCRLYRLDDSFWEHRKKEKKENAKKSDVVKDNATTESEDKMKISEDWTLAMQDDKHRKNLTDSTTTSYKMTSAHEDYRNDNLDIITSNTKISDKHHQVANDAIARNQTSTALTERYGNGVMYNGDGIQNNLDEGTTPINKQLTVNQDGRTTSRRSKFMSNKSYALDNIIFLNRPIAECEEDQPDVINNAPHVYEKLKLINPESKFLQITKEETPTNLLARQPIIESHTVEKMLEKEDEKATSGKTFRMILRELTELTQQTSMMQNESGRIENGNEKEIKNTVNFLQKTMLATAISTLRAKRKSITNLKRHSIIGNETLNDICLLMKCFRNKERFDLETVIAAIDAFNGLQNDLKMNSTPTVSQRDVTTTTVQKFSKIDFVPSNIQRNMVPGVCGERILSRLKVSPNTKWNKNCGNQNHIIKPIPERYGNITLTEYKGYTKYGPMEFHWTTLSSGYDMNMTEGEYQMSQYASNNHKNKTKFYFPNIKNYKKQPAADGPTNGTYSNTNMQQQHTNMQQQQNKLSFPKIKIEKDGVERAGLLSTNISAFAPLNTVFSHQ